MAYIDKIQKAREKAYSHSIATKILDLMEKLRLNKNENASRRWIWELLQNAKDVSSEEGKISVKIDLDINEKILEFKHNGRPFTSENITFLIEQVSTKERNNDTGNTTKTTGKFGTGFLTTHLLSEVVEISGVLKEPDEPYKKFNLTLDRSGRNIETIIKSVEQSLKELSKIDNVTELDGYCSNSFNTKFAYKLSENGVLVAKKGLKDLFNSLVFSLVFLPEIEAVYVEKENIKYEVLKDHYCIAGRMKLHTVIEDINTEIKEHKIITLTKDDVTIAVQVKEVDDQIFLKKFNESTPVLFCDFPLIGTEKFPFPVIVNCPQFNPTEPRDGVYLTNIDDEKINENKLTMLKAMELYYELLEFASQNNWGNMHLFAANINSTLDVDWLSNSWITNEIIKPIKEKLSFVPIVDIESGERKAIKSMDGDFQIWFPSHKDQKVRQNIWEQCNYWIPNKLPLQKDIDSWYSVLWKEYRNLTLEVLTCGLQEAENLINLESKLNGSTDSIEWINNYFILLNEESNFIENIIADKYSVIPNQNGVFKKKSELKIDKEIDEELKNVLDILGDDCREYLLHKKIYTGEIEYYVEEQKDIINKISEELSYVSNKNINEACFYLVSLFSDDSDFPNERNYIYQCCNKVFPEQVNEKRKIINWSKAIWEKVDTRIVKLLVQAIADNKNIDNLTNRLEFNNHKETLNWLNDFICFLNNNGYSFILNDKVTLILPNQNGYFHAKDDLFLDDGEIDEKLKNISHDLGYDFREELLSTDIFLELPQNRIKTQKDVADEISSMVRNKLSQSPIIEETKEIFRKLLLWFGENPDKAKEDFPDLYKKKHKLYDDVEVAANMEKAAKYDEIMDKFNVKDYESLEKILESTTYLNKGNLNNKQEITDNILAQLGIYTPEQLENAFKDEVFANNFLHVSNKDIIKFEYVQNIIERAIDNVLDFLESKPEYNLNDCEEIAKTIFSVSKNNEDIYIIVRPSDYNQIIIYYDSEKDLLDYEKDCELWIDDGISTPQRITFGKILKITGINKIPLKKII